MQYILQEHPYSVGCVAWSLDDTILLTAAENIIRMWDTRVRNASAICDRAVRSRSCCAQSGRLIRTLETHTDVVTALVWLPDGSGFISGGLDRKIILWVSVSPDAMDSVRWLKLWYQDADGKQRDSWGRTPIRVTDLAITPDFTRLVAIGMYDAPAPPAATPP